jgi:hypothetical protein
MKRYVIFQTLNWTQKMTPRSSFLNMTKPLGFKLLYTSLDRLCGLVVRVLGYRFRGSGFDSRHYQIFWEVVGLERGPLSLVSTTEVLLGRNSSGSGLENREYGRGDPLRWSSDTLYPQKLTLISPRRGGRSVGIIRLRTKTAEFVLFVYTSWDNTRVSSVGAATG